MTKAIAASAAMQLVEQGKLSLDAPIGALLPDLAHPQVLDGFDTDGAPLLRPARTAITLKHLLTHTAGYCYNTWNPGMARQFRQRAGLVTHSCNEQRAIAPNVAELLVVAVTISPATTRGRTAM